MLQLERKCRICECIHTSRYLHIFIGKPQCMFGRARDVRMNVSVQICGSMCNECACVHVRVLEQPVVPVFLLQHGDGTGGASIYGDSFPDEAFGQVRLLLHSIWH